MGLRPSSGLPSRSRVPESTRLLVFFPTLLPPTPPPPIPTDEPEEGLQESVTTLERSVSAVSLTRF